MSLRLLERLLGRRTPGVREPDPLEAFAAACPAPILVLRGDAIAFANAAACGSTGLRREQLLGARLSDLAADEFGPLLSQRLNQLQAGRDARPTRFELRLKAQGSEEPWLDLTLASVEYRGAPAVMVFALDVTDRRLAEDAMRESERRLLDLIENVQLISVLLDAGGRVTFCNEYVLDLLGYTADEIVGHDWFDLLLPEDARASVKRGYLERIARGEVVAHDEYEIVTSRGERRLVSWSNTALHDPAGAVVGMASIGADVTERRRAEERLLRDAFHDSLTALPNRALFMDRLRGAVARLKRRPEYLFAVLFLDVDRFKLINDSLGHVAGDQLLVQLSRAMAATLRRPEHTLARLGGDEFALLLDDIDERDDAQRIVDRLFEALAAPIRIGSQEIFATVSIGIAFGGAGYDTAEEILRDADTAMYDAKLSGKACARVFDDSMHRHALQQLKLENSLRRAVERSELTLHYQPIVTLASRGISGFEALVRWQHPERGLVSPAEFIELAEETGLIHAIGRFTLREAARQLAAWRVGAAHAGLTMSVNLSGRQFSQTGLIAEIEEVIDDVGIDSRLLKLEITESVIMENPEVAIAMLQRLKELGTRLCIDDFGTGYSSLSYLLRFPADTLKIDRSFVAALGHGRKNRDIVGAIVSLGRSLRMDIVAEGVETEAQREVLLALGCELGQGYLFSPPLAAGAAGALLR